MPTLKNLTVRYLRELARKHLGKGHSRLKTRDDLLAALRRVVPGLSPEAPSTSASAPASPPVSAPATARAEVIRFGERTTSAADRKATSDAPMKSTAGVAKGNGRQRTPAEVPAAEVVREPEEKMAAAPPAGPVPPPVVKRAKAPRPPPPPPVPVEPVVEGFFVARIAGEDEVRRHHLSAVHPPQESTSGPHVDERLPAVPLRYGDTNRLVLLVRDTGSMHVFWELSPQTRGSLQRAQLRLFSEGHEVRRVEVPLDAPGWYLYGVAPGRTYRAGLWEVGEDGKERAVGPSSNEATVPRDDLSDDTRARFMRVPWGVHLLRLREWKREEQAPSVAPASYGGVFDAPPAAASAPQGLSLEILREHWEPTANSGSWQLRTWMERVPLGEGAPPPAIAPPPGPDHVPLLLREYPLGGSSSFTLTSSFGLPSSHVSGSGSGRGGKS